MDPINSTERPLVEVCLNHRGLERPSCMASGSRKLLKELKSTLPKGTRVKPTTCMGYCDRGVVCRLSLGSTEPIMVVQADVQKVTDALGAFL